MRKLRTCEVKEPSQGHTAVGEGATSPPASEPPCLCAHLRGEGAAWFPPRGTGCQKHSHCPQQAPSATDQALDTAVGQSKAL